MPRPVCKLSYEERKQTISRPLKGDSIKNIVISYERCGETICRQTVWRLMRHCRTHGSFSPLPRSGRPTKLTTEVMDVIDSTMQDDDETTARELVLKLQGLSISMSKRTVLKGRKRL